MMSYEQMAELDNLLVAAIQAAQDQNKRTDLQLGLQAFGWMKSPIMKVQAIKGYGNRKPQQIRLADFINICEALGLSWQDEAKKALRTLAK